LRHLKVLNKYFWKYRYRLALGMIFVVSSNYFAILAPQVTGYVFDLLKNYKTSGITTAQHADYDWLVRIIIGRIGNSYQSYETVVALACTTILAFALISGLFMFLMRQTIIVMSRHVEFDQKNEVFQHYLKLDSNFYKTHSTGDLMSRMAEDVSRVRMYTGPAIMYFINLLVRISLCVYYMFHKDPLLTLFVLSPLPVLAIIIYKVNTIIHKRSERIQALLASLTTNAQESYSGIRVIKSFVQEKAMLKFFTNNSDEYKKHAIGLAKVEALYFPSMALLIGLSTLLTIMIGGMFAINGKPGMTATIVEFVMYINLLSFPVSAIGWTASMIQRASASQKRLNEFLHTEPVIQNSAVPVFKELEGNIEFHKVDFIYPNTGIQALTNFSIQVKKGQKIAIVGRTGSGKTTIAQLLLRFYDPTNGTVSIDGIDIRDLDMQHLRKQVSYVPQDVFLFSDSVSSNIGFGADLSYNGKVQEAAKHASVEREIESFAHQYDTVIGERGVTLSGGQKQRISIARALSKDPRIIVFDDCLSAVDAKTEKEIIGNLYRFLENKTAIIITHRIFSLFEFDKIIVLDEGSIIEQGTHAELLSANGYYTYLYRQQQQEKAETPSGAEGQEFL
jgi:ATP-binding cassette subfamily B multidrug efflux pump